MKLESSSIVMVAALFVLSCATVSPKPAHQKSDSQTVAEETLVSGIQYHLEDVYDVKDIYENPSFIIRTTGKNELINTI
jgi:hypothetical protein